MIHYSIVHCIGQDVSSQWSQGVRGLASVSQQEHHMLLHCMQISRDIFHTNALSFPLLIFLLSHFSSHFLLPLFSFLLFFFTFILNSLLLPLLPPPLKPHLSHYVPPLSLPLLPHPPPTPLPLPFSIHNRCSLLIPTVFQNQFSSS